MKIPRLAFALATAVAALSAPWPLHGSDHTAPHKVKVVVLPMYEIGEDTGDRPGELQFWVERYPGLTKLPFPLGAHDLYLSEDGVLLCLTGGGVTNATSTLMALGLDPRFDLSRAYFLVAGIAGADPQDMSLGSAAWARFVVDGDLLYEIDGREIPEEWPYGMIPLGAEEPNVLDSGWTVETIVYELNEELRDWAYHLTKDHPVADTPGLAEFRTLFRDYPAANQPPRVLRGDTIGASTYWHGELLNDWANDWVKLHTGGRGEFMTSNMEDNGTLTALKRLSGTGRIDWNRIMVLRTASNFTMPRPGETAAWSTTADYPDNGVPALEAAYQVGRRVVDEIVDGWDEYTVKIPGSPAEPIEIRTVVVTMFERGEDRGDAPGEYQLWVERLPLDEEIPFPQGHGPLRLNREMGVLGVVTGIGTAKSAGSIMALGLDPRFDLSNAYWLVAGIAGIDPEDATIGSAAWAEWLVDGDLSHEIDPREIPEEWPTGYLPLRRFEPYAQPLSEENEGFVYRLDPELTDWAYELTRDVELIEDDAMRALRSRYINFPEARKSPRVMKGDHLAAMTFWHGKLLNDWANDWVDYYTGGKGEFITSAMEDTGTYTSLMTLDAAGKVDIDRLMVLRSGSNFTMQHEGVTAIENLSGEKKGGYSAYLPSLEALWLTGSVVVKEIVGNWDQYRDRMPYE